MPRKNNLPKIGIRTILVFFSLALIIVGGIFVAFDPARQFQATSVLFGNTSSADGNININTILKDSGGNIIREYTPLGGSVLDQDTGAEVGSYVIHVTWDATGTNINWDSLLFIGTVNYVSYTGIGYYGQLTTSQPINQEIGSVSQNVNKTGQHDFTVFNIDTLVPATMAEFITEKEGSPRTVFVDQRTTTPHPVIFMFEGDFKVQVYDKEQNLLQSHFALHIELRLQWAGSTFDVSWNNGGSATTTTTTTTTTTAQGTDGGVDPKIVTSTDVTNPKSDEFIRMDTVSSGAAEASIFGGGASEDIGVVMIATGMILIVAIILMPSIRLRYGR
jgi:hypothetical protein